MMNNEVAWLCIPLGVFVLIWALANGEPAAVVVGLLTIALAAWKVLDKPKQ